MEAKLTRDYIGKNAQWLGNGDGISMGIPEFGMTEEGCQGIVHIL